ncbi:MAG: DUF167 domain-containing protein [Dehalococcoidia bacterium]|nr:DUF167 domain-containing protein [Dehalococcoidia bacterium]
MKIKVKVIPNSKTEEVVREGSGFLVRVKESAREGKANRAVVKLLADHFKVSRGSVVILSGFKNRNKVIEVSGI